MKNGYAMGGRRLLRGEKFRPYERTTRLVHRAIFQEITGVELPTGINACHTCDVRCCVNPSHIWPGTQLENLRDAISKGVELGTGRKYKTHCPKGHPYVEENTYLYKGYKSCRICIKDKWKKWGHKRKKK